MWVKSWAIEGAWCKESRCDHRKRSVSRPSPFSHLCRHRIWDLESLVFYSGNFRNYHVLAQQDSLHIDALHCKQREIMPSCQLHQGMGYRLSVFLNQSNFPFEDYYNVGNGEEIPDLDAIIAPSLVTDFKNAYRKTSFYRYSHPSFAI